MRQFHLLIGLAFRNLTRHKRRTIITALSLAIGLALFVLFDSLLAGMENDGVRNLIEYDTGGLQVQQKDYWDDRDLMPLDKSINDPKAVIAWLKSKGYQGTARAVFSGEMIINQDPWPESGSVRARFVAIDPTQDATVFRLQEHVAKGHWLQPGEEGIVIGAQMATDLGADIGYPVTITTRTRDGAYQTMDFPIVGIINTPNAAVNRINIYLNLDVADSYLLLEGSVNQIAVAFNEEADAEAAAVSISAGLKDLQSDLVVLPWRTTGADFLAFVQSRQGISKVLLLLVFIIAAVGVSNTMLLTILERRREIGMLRAQGMQDKELLISLLMEAGAIGVIGGLSGLILSLPFNLALIGNGLDLTYLLSQMNSSLPFSGQLRGAWHPLVMLMSVGAGIIMSVIVSILPVRSAMKLQITECLRQN